MKKNYTPKIDKSIANQADSMAIMQGKRNFLKLYGAFSDYELCDYRYTLVTELAKETLAQRILNWERGNVSQNFRENHTLEAAIELISAMCDLNAMNISHRNIKPDSIFIHKTVNKKIADLEGSRKINRDDGCTRPQNQMRLGQIFSLSSELRELKLRN